MLDSKLKSQVRQWRFGAASAGQYGQQEAAERRSSVARKKRRLKLNEHLAVYIYTYFVCSKCLFGQNDVLTRREITERGAILYYRVVDSSIQQQAELSRSVSADAPPILGWWMLASPFKARPVELAAGKLGAHSHTHRRAADRGLRSGAAAGKCTWSPSTVRGREDPKSRTSAAITCPPHPVDGVRACECREKPCPKLAALGGARVSVCIGAERSHVLPGRNSCASASLALDFNTHAMGLQVLLHIAAALATAAGCCCSVSLSSPPSAVYFKKV